MTSLPHGWGGDDISNGDVFLALFPVLELRNFFSKMGNHDKRASTVGAYSHRLAVHSPLRMFCLLPVSI